MFDLRKNSGVNPNTVTKSGPVAFNFPRTVPRGTILFVCPFSDFFIEEADAWRSDCWHLFKSLPDINFIIPTKRQERIANCLPDFWPLKNVFLGVSCENQYRYEERTDVLFSIPDCPGYVVIFEPLLGRITPGYVPRNSWGIVGGEIGQNNRPLNFDHVYHLRECLTAQNIPFYFHQIDGIKEIPDFVFLRQFPNFLVGG
jgi:protein gp37